MHTIVYRCLFIVMGIPILLCGYMYVNHQDFLEDVDAGNHYCEMVRAGSWPNYKNWDCHVDEDVTKTG